ncbi:unnamed protein product [Protopolystoma xenopodis]|uniref:Uncharacterized protein n=1 Tax=Protopolystoma xenopodis TaxID=117903 RepID=A0A3S5CMT1_9PLAT|nr:unnamed protein product [Protopolystoma xenopodis]
MFVGIPNVHTSTTLGIIFFFPVVAIFSFSPTLSSTPQSSLPSQFTSSNFVLEYNFPVLLCQQEDSFRPPAAGQA